MVEIAALKLPNPIYSVCYGNVASSSELQVQLKYFYEVTRAMDYQLLGKNIRKYRLQLGMRQDDLAEKVGCSNSHIGQIEHARGVPSLEVVVNIANALGVTVDQLLMDSLDCPEIVFLRDIEKRVQDLPVAAKLIACEMLQDLMEIIEKVRG